MKTRILIAADRLLVRHGLRCLLESVDAFAVCGDCVMEDVQDRLDELQPDLALLDVEAKDAHLSEVRALRRERPALTLVLLLSSGSMMDVKEALYAGVRGFVTEETAVERLVQALHRVAGGQTYVDPDLMQRLLYLIASEGPSTSATSLSDREMEVLRLSGQGYRPRLIADTLRLSPKTIHTHRENLKRKLHVETAADLDRFAVRWLRGEVTL